MALCGATYMADAMEIMLISYLSPIVGKLWSLSPVEEASLMAVVFGGELIGAFAWGLVGDLCGRRVSFMLSSFLVAAGGLASAFSTCFEMLSAQ